MPLTPKEQVLKYGAKADHYPQSNALTWWARKYRQGLYDQHVPFEEGDTLLDYGCGCGTWFPYWKSRKVVAKGYEPAYYSVEVAQSNGYDVTADTTLLRRYDWVCLNTVLMMVAEQEAFERVLMSALSVANKFVILDAMPENPPQWFVDAWAKLGKVVRTHEEFRKSIKKCGGVIHTDNVASVVDTKLHHYATKVPLVGKFLEWPAVLTTYGLDWVLRRLVSTGKYRIITGETQ